MYITKENPKEEEGNGYLVKMEDIQLKPFD
jgi:hypothetical protein